MGDGVFHGELVTDSCGQQGHGDFFDIPEVSPYAGPTQFDADADFPGEETSFYFVGFPLFRPPTRHL